MTEDAKGNQVERISRAAVVVILQMASLKPSPRSLPRGVDRAAGRPVIGVISGLFRRRQPAASEAEGLTPADPEASELRKDFPESLFSQPLPSP